MNMNNDSFVEGLLRTFSLRTKVKSSLWWFYLVIPLRCNLQATDSTVQRKVPNSDCFSICFNRSSRRKRGMASDPLFIISDFFAFSKRTLLWLP